jgi:hypothetical protein
MKQLKNTPWFLFLLVLFFVVHGTVENFGFIYFSEVIKIAGMILGLVLVFFLITRLIVKNTIHAALIVFFISAWLLFFGAIFDWAKSIQFLSWLHSYSIFVPFMLLTIVAFIILIRKQTALQNKLCFYLNVLLLIYCVYDLSVLTLKSTSRNKTTASRSINFDNSAVKTKPNIYLLLFDGYPGYKSLKDSFAFANDSLYHFLEQKQFKILPVFSNYNMTYYSMSSMLNMQYIDKSYTPLANTAENDQERIKEIKNAAVVSRLKAIGYHFTNYSIFDIADKPSVKGNSFVVSQATLLTNKIFFNKILKDIGWHFIFGKYRIPFIEKLYRGDERNNQFIEEQLTKNDSADVSAPRFVYAHLLMPHPPFFCDSMGNKLPAELVFDPKQQANKSAFLSYLKYSNKKLEAMVAAIAKTDPGAIIIVMSDHGYRDYDIGDRIEPLHFDNICAVRFPTSNYAVQPPLSNINLFPYIFNSAFNQKIPYLADSTIFLRDIKIAQ